MAFAQSRWWCRLIVSFVCLCVVDDGICKSCCINRIRRIRIAFLCENLQCVFEIGLSPFLHLLDLHYNIVIGLTVAGLSKSFKLWSIYLIRTRLKCYKK